MRTKSTRAKNLISTTVVLTATTLFARTIVVYYNVYLSGKIGSFGIGAFELIMSVYAFAKTASIAGVSLASTRMSAEEDGDFSNTMRRILSCCLTLGIVCGLILAGAAPYLSYAVLSDPPGAVVALKLLAVSLPFLSMSAAYGGYFVAKRKMRLYAPVQICEQIIRILFTIHLLEKFEDEPLEFSVCSIALAITLSEIVAFSFSAIFYRFISKSVQKTNVKTAFGVFFRRFSRLVLPVGGGALFRASLNTIYNILVPFGLRKSGASSERSLASYGVVQGMALPIVLYPSAITGVISLQLVPEIAALHAKNEKKEITYITKRILRMTLLFSITCAVILFAFAQELSLILFQNEEAAFFIRALSPLVPVMYLDTVTDGILKGLDLQMKVLGIGIVDSIVSLTLIYLLLPPFAITGYLVTIYAGECINTLLGQIELRKHLNIRFSLKNDFIFPSLCIGCAALLCKKVFVVNNVFQNALSLTFLILCVLTLSLLFLIATRTLKAEELHWARTLLFSKGKENVSAGE